MEEYVKIHHDGASIQKALEGRTIVSIMFGCRSNDFDEERFMGITLTLDNGVQVDVWACPGDCTSDRLDDFFKQSEPQPFIAISQLPL